MNHFSIIVGALLLNSEYAKHVKIHESKLLYRGQLYVYTDGNYDFDVHLLVS